MFSLSLTSDWFRGQTFLMCVYGLNGLPFITYFVLFFELSTFDFLESLC